MEGFDMAVRIGALRDSTLLARRLGTVRFVTCASPIIWRATACRAIMATWQGISACTMRTSRCRHGGFQTGAQAGVAIPGMRLHADNGDLRHCCGTGRPRHRQRRRSSSAGRSQAANWCPARRNTAVSPSESMLSTHRGDCFRGRCSLLADFLANRFGDLPDWDRTIGITSWRRRQSARTGRRSGAFPVAATPRGTMLPSPGDAFGVDHLRRVPSTIVNGRPRPMLGSPRAKMQPECLDTDSSLSAGSQGHSVKPASRSDRRQTRILQHRTVQVPPVSAAGVAGSRNCTLSKVPGIPGTTAWYCHHHSGPHPTLTSAPRVRSGQALGPDVDQDAVRRSTVWAAG